MKNYGILSKSNNALKDEENGIAYQISSFLSKGFIKSLDIDKDKKEFLLNISKDELTIIINDYCWGGRWHHVSATAKEVRYFEQSTIKSKINEMTLEFLKKSNSS